MRLSYSETVPHIILHLLEVIAGTTLARIHARAPKNELSIFMLGWRDKANTGPQVTCIP
jgi:hypothetical protein